MAQPILTVLLFGILCGIADCYYTQIEANYGAAYGDSTAISENSVVVSTDYDIVKLDARGRSEWSLHSTEGHKCLQFVAPSNNNEFFALGSSRTSIEPTLAKFDAFGNKIWAKKYSGIAKSSKENAFGTLFEDTDGSLYVTGIRNDNPSFTAPIAKIDSKGFAEWCYIYHGLFYGSIASYKDTLIVTGNRHDNKKYFIVVFHISKKDGSLLNAIQYSSTDNTNMYVQNSLQQVHDLFLIGNRGDEMLAMKISDVNSGQQRVSWAVTYKINTLKKFSFRGEQIAMARDNSLLIAATSQHKELQYTTQYPYILKVSQSDGHVKWAKSWPQPHPPSSIFVSGNDIFIHFMDRPAGHNSRWHIVKLDSDGNYSGRNCLEASMDDKTDVMQESDILHTISASPYQEKPQKVPLVTQEMGNFNNSGQRITTTVTCLGELNLVAELLQVTLKLTELPSAAEWVWVQIALAFSGILYLVWYCLPYLTRQRYLKELRGYHVLAVIKNDNQWRALTLRRVDDWER